MISFNAIKNGDSKQEFYTAFISARELIKRSFITRAEDDLENGFQRHLNKTRAKIIADYLKEGGVIPTPLILSAQLEAKLKYSRGKLLCSTSKKSFMILDGQHRLYGYDEYLKSGGNDKEIPVIIFNNLTTSDEVSYFIDINTSQRGVSSSLLLHIKKLTKNRSKADENLDFLFKSLNSSGPLAGKLSATKTTKGKISKKLFNDVFSKCIDKGPLSEHTLDIYIKAVRNYVSAIEQVVKNANSKKAITNAVIFRAYFDNFNEVLGISLSKYGDLKISSLYGVIKNTASIDFDDISGTNLQTVQALSREISMYLVRKVEIDAGKMF